MVDGWGVRNLFYAEVKARFCNLQYDFYEMGEGILIWIRALILAGVQNEVKYMRLESDLYFFLMYQFRLKEASDEARGF